MNDMPLQHLSAEKIDQLKRQYTYSMIEDLSEMFNYLPKRIFCKKRQKEFFDRFIHENKETIKDKADWDYVSSSGYAQKDLLLILRDFIDDAIEWEAKMGDLGFYKSVKGSFDHGYSDELDHIFIEYLVHNAHIKPGDND